MYTLKSEGCKVTWYIHTCKWYVTLLCLVSFYSDDCEIINTGEKLFVFEVRKVTSTFFRTNNNFELVLIWQNITETLCFFIPIISSDSLEARCQKQILLVLGDDHLESDVYSSRKVAAFLHLYQCFPYAPCSYMLRVYVVLLPLYQTEWCPVLEDICIFMAMRTSYTYCILFILIYLLTVHLNFV